MNRNVIRAMSDAEFENFIDTEIRIALSVLKERVEARPEDYKYVDPNDLSFYDLRDHDEITYERIEESVTARTAVIMETVEPALKQLTGLAEKYSGLKVSVDFGGERLYYNDGHGWSSSSC